MGDLNSKFQSYSITFRTRNSHSIIELFNIPSCFNCLTICVWEKLLQIHKTPSSSVPNGVKSLIYLKISHFYGLSELAMQSFAGY